MAGVYIRGMEMPESCLDCKVHYVWGTGRPQCPITGEFIDDPNAYEQKRLDNCPIIPVPDYGRLVDMDELCKKLLSAPEARFTPKELAWVLDCEEVAPTIIPAEEGKHRLQKPKE